jgi:hypothetical protein
LRGIQNLPHAKSQICIHATNSKKGKNMSTKDRYVSFENIDCYNNAQAVLEAMEELFSLHVDAKNEFWERFLSKLPDDYKNNPIDEGGTRYALSGMLERVLF